MCKLGVISQERLKIEVKLLLSANRKSYMPRRLAQQRMTLNDFEWPFHPRALSLTDTGQWSAELVVVYLTCMLYLYCVLLLLGCLYTCVLLDRLYALYCSVADSRGRGSGRGG